jgi:hypothetical protein
MGLERKGSEQSPTQNKKEYRPSVAALGWMTGVATFGFIGQRYGTRLAFEHGLIGPGSDNDPFSLPAHASNFYDTGLLMSTVESVALTAAQKLRNLKKGVFTRVTPRRALAVAAIATAVGAAANVTSEVRPIDKSDFYRNNAPVIFQDKNPNPGDLGVGVTAALIDGTIIFLAARGRKKDELPGPTNLGPAGINPSDLPPVSHQGDGQEQLFSSPLTQFANVTLRAEALASQQWPHHGARTRGGRRTPPPGGYRRP